MLLLYRGRVTIIITLIFSELKADHLRTCVFSDAHINFFARVTLTLTQWPWYTNLKELFWRYTCTQKITFLGSGFQKLQHKQDRQAGRQIETRPNALSEAFARCDNTGRQHTTDHRERAMVCRQQQQQQQQCQQLLHQETDCQQFSTLISCWCIVSGRYVAVAVGAGCREYESLSTSTRRCNILNINTDSRPTERLQSATCNIYYRHQSQHKTLSYNALVAFQ